MSYTVSQPLPPCRECQRDEADALMYRHYNNGRGDEMERIYWSCTRECARCRAKIKAYHQAWARVKRGEMTQADLRYYCCRPEWHTEANKAGYKCSSCCN